MTLTLATTRSRVKAILDDATQNYYTTDQIDAAIRQALEEYSRIRIRKQTYLAESNGAKRQALSADFTAYAVIDIADPDNENHMPFYATLQNGQWIIEFTDTIPDNGANFTVSYNGLHTLNGLDGATETTIETQDESAFCLGAAGYAQTARASSRTEANNLNPETSKQLLDQGTTRINLMRQMCKSHHITIAHWKW